MKNGDETEEALAEPGSSEGKATSRRQILMWGGLAAAYGTLAAQGILFLVPDEGSAPTRLVFAGLRDRIPLGEVRTFRDLQGRPILVQHNPDGLRAFSSTCPHLGCQVHWEDDEEIFFCPCHRGVFDPDGVAVSGPPADAGQRLSEVPLEVDEETGVFYLEVPATGRRG